MKSNMQILIRDKEDYLNKFNDMRISPELNDYILDECKTLNPKHRISIEINTYFDMEILEKKHLVEMIKLSCKDDIEEIDLLLRKYLIMDLFSLFFGVLCLIFYFFIKSVPVLSELVLIIGWVLIWEAIYNFLFSMTENRIKINRRKQIIKSEFIFKQKDN